MKRLALITLLVISPTLYGIGVWNRVKNWFTQEPTKEQLQCPEFMMYKQDKSFQSFQELPTDLKREIIFALALSANIEEATNTLRSFLQTSKLRNIFGDARFYKQVIDLIANKNSVSPALVHLYIGTKIDILLLEKYIVNNYELFKVYQDAKYFDYLLSTVRARRVFKFIQNKLLQRLPNNEQQCWPLWMYPDNSSLCIIAEPPVINFSIARFNAQGTADTYFGGINLNGFNQIQRVPPNGIINFFNSIFLDFGMQNDGKFIIALYSFDDELLLIRFNSDGSLDNTFGTDGNIAINIDHYDIGGVDIYNYMRKNKTDFKLLFIDPIDGAIIFKVKNNFKKFSPIDGHEL